MSDEKSKAWKLLFERFRIMASGKDDDEPYRGLGGDAPVGRLITIDDFRTFDAMEEKHINMGGAGFGYGHRAIAYPRLQFIDRYLTGLPRESRSFDRHTKIKEVKREWYVDGVQVADLEAAVAALNVPPAFTDEERAALAQIPKRQVPYRVVRDIIAGEKHEGVVIEFNSPTSKAIQLIDRLRNKGAVEVGRRPADEEHEPELDEDGLPSLKPMDELDRWRTEPMIRRLIDV